MPENQLTQSDSAGVLYHTCTEEILETQVTWYQGGGGMRETDTGEGVT